MTRKEYQKIVEIIDKNMVVFHDQANMPRVVLTTNGFHNVKTQLRELIKEE